MSQGIESKIRGHTDEEELFAELGGHFDAAEFVYGGAGGLGGNQFHFQRKPQFRRRLLME